ncbi:MAG: sigma 54-interacting transcriptional regulator [Nannocystaceae bacterium]|nr:sigma 54-interacting transcriptional regulator [Nannocystaceae bacterium]
MGPGSFSVELGRFKLLVISDRDPVAHSLPDRGRITVGRSETADVQVPDPLISRVHAAITLGETLMVRDLGSSNGTIVRGEKIAPNVDTPINVGETIDFGSTVVIVQREVLGGHAGHNEPPLSDEQIEGKSDSMRRLHRLARRVASSRINVLLLGETGVGKEIMASTLHRMSPRASSPFLGINCASLTDTLFESELFGYEKGAFTGAVAAKPGLIEAAHTGTFFLDEIGEMPLSAQAKLLRVLELRAVHRVGSIKQTPVDVRFVSATHRNLADDVAAGRFREDLFYRLNGISLVIPPLRERTDEILPLARTFLAEATRDAGFGTVPLLSADAVAWMKSYEWPGNIRELKNAINRAVLLSTGGIVQTEHLAVANTYSPGLASPAPTSGFTIPSAVAPTSEGSGDERLRIIQALADCGGNQTRAAKQLGISRRTLSSRLNQLNIPRPRKK